MESPFVNDPFSMVYQAFKNLYPEKASQITEIIWQPEEMKADDGNRCVGMTNFANDGDITVYVCCRIPVADAVETLAHELAHVAVGHEQDHNDVWEKAFDDIHDEFDRIGAELFGDEGVSVEVSDAKVGYGKTVEEYEKDIIELAANACMTLVPEEYEAMMKRLTLVFRDLTNKEADSFPVEIKEGEQDA